MFAIVKIGSLQFKVAEGDTIRPNRLNMEKGADITLDQVLMYSDGKQVRVGRPFLKDVEVRANVGGEALDDKVVAFKYRLRKSSSTKKGHRQQRTVLNITKIAVK